MNKLNEITIFVIFAILGLGITTFGVIGMTGTIYFNEIKIDRNYDYIMYSGLFILFGSVFALVKVVK